MGDAPQASRSASEMVHVASYSIPDKPAAATPITAKPNPTRPTATKPLTDKAQEPAAATKLGKSAMADPLAPLSSAKAKAKGFAPVASAGANSQKRMRKDSDSD